MPYFILGLIAGLVVAAALDNNRKNTQYGCSKPTLVYSR